jgi:hypothetical protein
MRLCTQERLNPESVKTLAQELATDGLLLVAAMMTRILIIHHYKRVNFTLSRWTSTDLFFSCWRSVAGNDLGNTVKYLRQTTTGSAGIGLGTKIKNLRRTTSAAAGNGLRNTPNYLRGAAVSGRAQRSSTCGAQRAPPRATA